MMRSKADVLFLFGAVIEIYALSLGVSTNAVAWSLVAYGVVLLVTGYVS